ncbi:ComF family protein [Paenibacillus sp. NPDC058071]|uniref:ComF family protein n=1 Tax=Paenibacillus sp. NPDC058071 TaxID=3346326 RepID=UPI0036DF7F04
MFLSSLHHLFRRSAKGLSNTFELLGASSQACLLCTKSVSFVQSDVSIPANTPRIIGRSLCNDCLSSIPWLQRIRCPICGRGSVCGDCVRRSEPQFIANRSAVHYSETMKEWLALYKYRGNERLSTLFAQMMLPAAAQLAALQRPSNLPVSRHRRPPWDVITYVPISTERAEERGFNQAEQFASFLSQQLRVPLHHLLVRERHTEKQSFKSRAERIRNTAQLFRASLEEMNNLLIASTPPSVIPSQPHRIRVLLIDDIYTTGSTVQACSSALQQQALLPLEIYSLTWARS